MAKPTPDELADEEQRSTAIGFFYYAKLGYAWDVHDIHKHGQLTQRTPVLPNGRRPQVRLAGGAFSSAFSDAFQKARPHAVLTLPDGTTVTAVDVVTKCADWWDVELTRLGWP